MRDIAILSCSKTILVCDKANLVCNEHVYFLVQKGTTLVPDNNFGVHRSNFNA
jgi:hypothetical protein